GKIEVGLFGMRYGADLLAGRRIEDRQCLAADSRPPRALDEQVDVGVHGDLVLRMGIVGRRTLAVEWAKAHRRPCNWLSPSWAFAHAVCPCACARRNVLVNHGLCRNAMPHAGAPCGRKPPPHGRARDRGAGALVCDRMLIRKTCRVAVTSRRKTPMRHTTNAYPRSLIAGVIVAATFGWAALAENAAVPNFAPDTTTGWISGVPEGETPIGDDFLQPPSGPGPVTFDRAHPFIDNRASRRSGKSATNRVADLSNPILQPWVREELRKLNQRALSEIMLWTPKERCWPIGVPGWLLYPVRPLRFLQTPKQVVMVWEEDHMVRHVYLTDQHSPKMKPSWFGESI